MFAAVIVDDPDTQLGDGDGPIPEYLGEIVEEDGGLLLDFGDTTFTLLNGLEFPTASDLSLRLAKTVFVATVPENWRDYSSEEPWNPIYPALPIKASILVDNDPDLLPVAVKDLDAFMNFYFDEDSVETNLIYPEEDVVGVGEVWVNAQFEKTAGKSKPGTATVVDATTWEVTKKVALDMNNPHNMWPNEDQTVIYQTEWFSNKLVAIDRETGDELSQVTVGESPSHVMTRPNNDDITVALNGEEGVAEILATDEPTDVHKIIATQGYGLDPTHPHGQWISSDGQIMITPNAFTHDVTIYDFDEEEIIFKTSTGLLPLATAMTPDDKYGAVANTLSSSLSFVNLNTGIEDAEINLLEHYNPFVLADITGSVVAEGGYVAALPIQTPISPDGKYMVTANTLTTNITIVDLSDQSPINWDVVAVLPCDPGCHGVQFGAKYNPEEEENGYYAYVSSKFANDLIVIDMDTLEIVGRILITDDEETISDDYSSDDAVEALHGMGGQGLMPIPNVYNGWVQNLPDSWKDQLTDSQKNPLSL